LWLKRASHAVSSPDFDSFGESIFLIGVHKFSASWRSLLSIERMVSRSSRQVCFCPL